ncbi:hypothetical protein PQX77_018275 [Marasmius sp. AFHP31]|nr:hypothetical protein PQX77_018275 [Marasmius sp. AFHP31]
MNPQDRWHECLRLQGNAEIQWLRLCGYPPDNIPQLVEERRNFRADTVRRYNDLPHDKTRDRKQMERRIRSLTRRLGNSHGWGPFAFNPEQHGWMARRKVYYEE